MRSAVFTFVLAMGLLTVGTELWSQDHSVSQPQPNPAPAPAPGTVTRETSPEPLAPAGAPIARPIAPAPHQPPANPSPSSNTSSLFQQQPDYSKNPYWQPRDWTYVENQAP